MAEQINLLAYAPRDGRHRVPWIPADWLLTIDLDGVPRVYLDAWRQGLFGRERNGRILQRAREVLSADYVVHSKPGSPPPARLRYAYSCVYANDRLPEACMTLLQLGVRARMRLLVQDRGRVTSFAVATERPAIHVVRQFFRETEEIGVEAFEGLASGRALRPRILTRFSLPLFPDLPVADSASSIGEVSGPPLDAAIRLGDILSPINGKPLGPAFVTLQALNQHALVAGTTGAGKTNTVFRLIQEAQPHVKGVLVFDVKKEYRSLHATSGARVLGFSGRNLLTHNLLKPVGAPAQWVKEFSSIFSEVINRYVPAVGSKDIVAETLDKLYQERGIYDGSVNYPHMGDLIEALEKRPTMGREAGWSSSALRVLRSLMIGSTRQAFCVREGIALETLIEGVTIVELDGLGDHAGAALLVSVLLQKIRHKLERGPTDALRHLIVFEEAQHLLAMGQESTSVLTTTCREIRYLGVGLVFVTQLPSELSKHALANVNTFIIHRLVRPQDVNLANTLLRQNDGAEGLVTGLRTGQALVRTDGLNLAQIPEVARSVVRDDALSQGVPNPSQRHLNYAERAELEKRLSRLTGRDWAVFNAIAESKAINPRAIRMLLKRSQNAAGASLTRLIGLGLVAYAKAHTGQGRPPSIYYLRPWGVEAYTMRNGRAPDRIHRAKGDHKAMVDEVTRLLGIERVPDPRFDILYLEDGREKAIEVETGSNRDEQVLENLRKSLELQAEARFVVADDVTMNRVLQAGASHFAQSGEPTTIQVAIFVETRAGAWLAYRFETGKPDTT
ncbi:MAG: ATP-binding protein [Euryarchaeota archaeon]|nr:ATP-binding protein [Euryarchaeota archaeon]